MSKLKIQPVYYEGKRLNEVGDRIYAVLNPLIDNYEIGDELRAPDLEAKLKSNGEPPLPHQLQIIGEDFIPFLSNYETPILAITSLQSIRDRRKRNRVHGMGSGMYKAAYVSAEESRFRELDSDTHIERVVIIGLHEVGHIFELDHHDGPLMETPKTLSGKYCPMTKFRNDMTLSGRISWEEYISLVDANSFCTECYGLLGVSTKLR